MGWLDGLISGYAQRNREIAAEQLQQAQLANEREARVYEALLNSNDPTGYAQTLGRVGLLNSAAPLRRKSGLQGFMGEMEQNPIWPVVAQYANTPQLMTRTVYDTPDTTPDTLSQPSTPAPPTDTGTAPKPNATAVPGQPPPTLGQSTNSPTTGGAPPAPATPLPSPQTGLGASAGPPPPPGAQSAATPPPAPPTLGLGQLPQLGRVRSHQEQYYDYPHIFSTAAETAAASRRAQEQGQYEGYVDMFRRAGDTNPEVSAANLMIQEKRRMMGGAMSPIDQAAMELFNVPSARLVPQHLWPQLQKRTQEIIADTSYSRGYGSAKSRYQQALDMVDKDRVAWVAKQATLDATLLPKLTSGASQAFKDEVGKYMAANGWNPQVFSESTRAAAELAHNVLKHMDRIAGEIQTLAAHGALGPIQSRWKAFLENKIDMKTAAELGVPPADLALFDQFRQDAQMMQGAVSKAHYGMRGAGSPGVLNHAQELFDAASMDPVALLSSMVAMQQWMQGYANDLPNFGNPWGHPGREEGDPDPGSYLQQQAGTGLQQQGSNGPPPPPDAAAAAAAAAAQPGAQQQPAAQPGIDPGFRGKLGYDPKTGKMVQLPAGAP